MAPDGPAHAERARIDNAVIFFIEISFAAGVAALDESIATAPRSFRRE
jgi:hypothetical protein